MPKKNKLREEELLKPYHKKKANKYQESDILHGLYVSQMNGKDFEVDKDVEKDKRIDPSKVFQNYGNKTKGSSARKTEKKKKNKDKKKMDNPQPVHEDKKRRGAKYGM